jgi:two-component system sensor histidine kinase YesM
MSRENGRLFLISSNNVSYPSTTKMPQEVFKTDSDQEKISVDGTVYHTLSKEFSLNGWKLRAIFPDKDLRSGQGAYLNLAGTLILFLFVVGTVMMFGVGRFISKPIQQLAKKSKGQALPIRMVIWRYPIRVFRSCRFCIKALMR